jgi:hypothetical protein
MSEDIKLKPCVLFYRVHTLFGNILVTVLPPQEYDVIKERPLKFIYTYNVFELIHHRMLMKSNAINKITFLYNSTKM